VITPAETGVVIDGKYFTVVGGYQSTKRGNFFIEYKNLLAVDRVRRRSKKIFFGFILLGSMWVAVPPLFNIVRKAMIFFDGIDMEYISVAIAVIVGIVFILSIIFLLSLLFSNRAYIEFTFIGGVIRVPCPFMRKSDTLRLVSEIRKRKEQV
jgi:hypothetical protein